jgi:23S rRNA-/tRNA-specific pseudouridylate synthase
VRARSMSVRANRSTSWALAMVSVLLLNLCTGFITRPGGRLETLRCLPNGQPVRDLDASYAASFNQGLYPEQLIYVDDDIIVVDKPANIQTAPGFVSRDCLASTIAQMFSLPRVDRMIVHRLDYATSGVVVFARNDDSLKALHTQLRQQRVYKAYVAVVSGRLSSFEGEIDLPLGKDPDRGPPFCRVDPLSLKAKNSTTVWRAVAVGASNSLVRLRPATGR